MIDLLLCALAALPPVQGPQTVPVELEALTDDAWRIVAGRVAEVRELPLEDESGPFGWDRGTPGSNPWRERVVWYARVTVERPLLGAEQELWVDACDWKAGAGRLFAAGDQVLLFLVPHDGGETADISFVPDWTAPAELRGVGAEEAFAGQVVYRPLPGGCWKHGYRGYAHLRGVEVTLPEELSRDPDHVLPQELEPWIAARLDATCPSARATMRSTGPSSPRLEIDAAGAYSTTPRSWSDEGRRTGQFAPEELAPFWRAVDEHGFHALPRRLQARSAGPESPTITLRVRTREYGTHAVSMIGIDVPRQPLPEDPTGVERMVLVWRALPGEVFPRPPR
jgi:hypothetical protein